ncbi:hypothetical protein LTR37_008117 [Vermiconidia calcicola]|uniref:Uncharacterized protein n=1 Tax=Vermiconidia calcicola TaxID=1690605 RepID=A0ACC3NC15_9PEZI|nr:hypothetical protein LTR37_008117 [Vermiconidia calcicola]
MLGTIVITHFQYLIYPDICLHMLMSAILALDSHLLLSYGDRRTDYFGSETKRHACFKLKNSRGVVGPVVYEGAAHAAYGREESPLRIPWGAALADFTFFAELVIDTKHAMLVCVHANF